MIPWRVFIDQTLVLIFSSIFTYFFIEQKELSFISSRFVSIIFIVLCTTILNSTIPQVLLCYFQETSFHSFLALFAFGSFITHIIENAFGSSTPKLIRVDSSSSILYHQHTNILDLRAVETQIDCFRAQLNDKRNITDEQKYNFSRIALESVMNNRTIFREVKRLFDDCNIDESFLTKLQNEISKYKHENKFVISPDQEKRKQQRTGRARSQSDVGFQSSSSTSNFTSLVDLPPDLERLGSIASSIISSDTTNTTLNVMNQYRG